MSRINRKNGRGSWPTAAEWLVAAGLVLGHAGAAPAQEHPAQASAPAAVVESESPASAGVEPVDEATAPRTGLAREVSAARAEFSTRIGELNALYARAGTPAERAVIAREVAAAKLGLEERIVQIHLRHARAAGDEALVAELEAAQIVAGARVHAIGVAAATPAASAAAAR